MYWRWGKLNTKNKIQLSCTIFLTKYGSLDIYDEYLEKYSLLTTISYNLIKNDGYNLIGIPEKPDGTLCDHEYFYIHYDLFDRVQPTHQDRNIMWRFISNEPNENEYYSEAT